VAAERRANPTAEPGEGLADGAEVDHPIWVESGQGANRSPVVAELGVVVVLDEDRTSVRCPAEELGAPCGGQGHAAPVGHTSRRRCQ
jgi:hypothetical protein